MDDKTWKELFRTAYSSDIPRSGQDITAAWNAQIELYLCGRNVRFETETKKEVRGPYQLSFKFD